MKKIVLLIGFLILSSSAVFAQQGQRGGPPPEAYTACEGKQVGDSAELTTPSGEIITGTCESERGELVLRPTNPPQGNNQPPQQ